MKPLILALLAVACFAATDAPQARGETRVTFNAAGIALVNGKPIFPIGIWTYEITPVILDDLKSKHFNTVIGSGFKPADLDAIYQAGMLSVPFATKEFLAMKNHDGLLAWYVTDEPEGHGNAPDDIKKLREQLHRDDPNHPGGLCHFLFDAFEKYKDGCDYVMSDNYPVTANRDVPLKNVGIHIAEAHRAHGSENFPVWAFIQIFGGPGTDGGKWAQPEPDEVRCMTFIALQQRAAAINYFSYWPQAPKTWSSIEKLNADLVELTPYLIADGEEVPVKSDNEAIWARARKFAGGSLIFAVNTERKAVDAKILRDGEVVKDVSGTFAPCEVKIQKVRKPAS
jgi:hypothetical protein